MTRIFFELKIHSRNPWTRYLPVLYLPKIKSPQIPRIFEKKIAQIFLNQKQIGEIFAAVCRLACGHDGLSQLPCCGL